jgi:hypothetical protein
MLARRSKLNLPDSSDIELPLLVPSFSSKGAPFTVSPGNKENRTSAVAADLRYFSTFPSQSVLVSAYDLHFNHFRNGRSTNAIQWLNKTRLIFIDSGGYELNLSFDSTESKIPHYEARSGYGQEQYIEVLKKITKEPFSLIIANYDHSSKIKPIESQIKQARTLFREYGGTLSDFILKPWEVKGILSIDDLSPSEIQNFRDFSVIGVTEKDLGKNLWDRITNIIKLRSRLNDESISTPIHIWGGLDPVITPLYYFAGAEIFDGVSWLRYAYFNGLAINKECYPVFNGEEGIKTSIEMANPLRLMKNYQFLAGMGDSLRLWHDGGGRDFRMFDQTLAPFLQMAYDKMKSAFPQI